MARRRKTIDQLGPELVEKVVSKLLLLTKAEQADVLYYVCEELGEQLAALWDELDDLDAQKSDELVVDSGEGLRY